jgi:NAD(P)-dependent dehydrogenase (short-subunit alcohol dehydrogenase family)
MANLGLKGKTALITGASRGIGKAIAERYIREGAHVIALARSLGELEILDDYAKSLGKSITIVPLDLRELDKIDQLGVHILQKFSKLDIFVGNAGILGILTPLAHLDSNIWDEVIKVNLTANFRLLKTLDGVLNRAEAGRVIFVSSDLTSYPTAYWNAFSVSKVGLENMAKIYAQEVKPKVKVNIVHPGKVATSFLKQAMPGLNYDEINTPENVTDIFVTLANNDLVETGQVFSL